MAYRPRRKPNAGRWELERERHQLPAHLSIPTEDDVTTAGKLATELIEKIGLKEKLWGQQLLDGWVEIVGDAVARRARPGQVFRGVLTIYVSNATWLNELSRYGKPEMLAKLQSRFGQKRITDLRFQPDPDLRSLKKQPV